MFKKIFIILLFLCFFIPPTTLAQEKEETLEGTIVEILEEKLPYQKLEILVTKGSLEDTKIQIETGKMPTANQPVYQKGNELLISYSKNLNGNDIYFINDFIRKKPIFWLAVIFTVLVLAVAHWRGLASILGLGISFAVIFVFILPCILAGKDPVLVVLAGSLAIVPTTFYLSHGINKKTTIAIAAALVTLFISVLLSILFVNGAKLTGFSSEEAGFIQSFKQGSINIKGLLLAGIIIGLLGILDDVTINQTAVVEQLKKANNKLNLKQLYIQSMAVGSDHIASMVNTLILVYAGASLPLLLLFVDNPHPFSEVINYEIVAEEIVRMLIGSIGLVLAVPLASFLAAWWFSKK